MKKQAGLLRVYSEIPTPCCFSPTGTHSVSVRAFVCTYKVSKEQRTIQTVVFDHLHYPCEDHVDDAADVINVLGVRAEKREAVCRDLTRIRIADAMKQLVARGINGVIEPHGICIQNARKKIKEESVNARFGNLINRLQANVDDVVSSYRFKDLKLRIVFVEQTRRLFAYRGAFPAAVYLNGRWQDEDCFKNAEARNVYSVRAFSSMDYCCACECFINKKNGHARTIKHAKANAKLLTNILNMSWLLLRKPREERATILNKMRTDLDTHIRTLVVGAAGASQ